MHSRLWVSWLVESLDVGTNVAGLVRSQVGSGGFGLRNRYIKRHHPGGRAVFVVPNR